MLARVLQVEIVCCNLWITVLVLWAHMIRSHPSSRISMLVDEKDMLLLIVHSLDYTETHRLKKDSYSEYTWSLSILHPQCLRSSQLRVVLLYDVAVMCMYDPTHREIHC